MRKLCANCRNLFEVARHVPEQTYCSAAACQKARKAAWMSKKLATDSDYKTNQRKAQKSWQMSNPGYWKKYRDQLSDDKSVKTRQKKSKHIQPSTYPDSNVDLNGLFELKIISQIRRVKIDVYIVEIKRHKGPKQNTKSAKR